VKNIASAQRFFATFSAVSLEGQQLEEFEILEKA